MLHTETMTVARIHLAAGAHVPSHAHANEQVANVLEGRLRFVVGDEEQVVEAGETLFLPANVPHEAEALADSLVLDVFSPVREDWVQRRRRLPPLGKRRAPSEPRRSSYESPSWHTAAVHVPSQGTPLG